MHQALGHPPPLALGFCPYASGRWQKPVTELKGGLLADLELGGGRHVNANLGSWLGITRWLLGHNLAQCPGWGLRRSINWEPERLIIDTLLFLSKTDSRGRRSTTFALRLLRLSHRMSAGQEPINCHFSPCHHLSVLSCLGCFFWLSWLGWSFQLFNRYVDLTALRDALS